MTRKKLLIGFLALVVGYILFDQFKGDVVGFYVDNFMARPTATPSSTAPDQITLTWSSDPQTTQTVQWRTAPEVTAGWVEFALAEADPDRIEAARTVIADKLVENDPDNSRFTATMTGLKPGTEYRYRVGDSDTWSDWYAFTTAPPAATDFSFVYLGDAQIGMDTFGKTLAAAYSKRPAAAFTIIAGDLVNSGSYRSEWDDFFANAHPWFAQRTLIPVLGNHDYDPDAPYMYLDLFTLPENGPADFPPERAYSYTYGNALFIVLDSNINIEDQVDWLDQTLTQHADATWKIATYHHPAYASRRSRDNREVRELWGGLFDKHHLDVAIQGHDHAYLRTFPMYAGGPVESPANGTYYIVSVAGSKYYEQEAHDYTEVGFENTSTYQIIDIETTPNRLRYRAFDLDGKERDAFVIEK